MKWTLAVKAESEANNVRLFFMSTNEKSLAPERS
jgi:hypothetical protein